MSDEQAWCFTVLENALAGLRTNSVSPPPPPPADPPRIQRKIRPRPWHEVTEQKMPQVTCAQREETRKSLRVVRPSPEAQR